MRKIGALAMDVAVKLEPKIEAVATMEMEEAEITIKVKHGWVASIGIFVIELYKKFKAGD
jgi:hypothetical protein